jgi:purine-binding chemotaxis protein CheW
MAISLIMAGNSDKSRETVKLLARTAKNTWWPMSTTAQNHLSAPAGSIEPAAAPTRLDDFVANLQQKLNPGLSDSSFATGQDSFGSFGIGDSNDKFEQEQYVLFFLAQQPYAFPIQSVVEIIRPLAVTPIPYAPRGIEGLVNLRGRTLPIINLRTWLDLAPIDGTENASRKRVVVYQGETEPVGFMVDEVAEVIGFNLDAIERPDHLSETIHAANVRGFAQYNEFVVTLIESIEVAA